MKTYYCKNVYWINKLQYYMGLLYSSFLAALMACDFCQNNEQS